MANTNEYMTFDEAAEFPRVSKDSLRRWDRAGKLTARRQTVTGNGPYLVQKLYDLRNREDKGEKSASVSTESAPSSEQDARAPLAPRREPKRTP